jgi:hypothetical protein
MDATTAAGSRPPAPSPFARIARWATRHRRLALAGWVAVLVAVSALSSGVGASWRNDFSLPGTESQRVADLFEDRGAEQAGDTLQVVVQAPDGVDAPNVRERVRGMLDTGRGAARRRRGPAARRERGRGLARRDDRLRLRDARRPRRGRGRPRTCAGSSTRHRPPRPAACAWRSAATRPAGPRRAAAAPPRAPACWPRWSSSSCSSGRSWRRACRSSPRSSPSGPRSGSSRSPRTWRRWRTSRRRSCCSSASAWGSTTRC